jgi:signal recognition particle subunit SRP54
VQDVNKLLKQFDDLSTVMKRMNKMGGQAAMLRQMQAAMGGQGGAPQIGGPRGGRRPF